MKFLLAILVLAIIVYVSPLREPAVKYFHQGTQFLESTVASGSAPLYARIQTFGDSVRSKSMGLIRRELHDAINGLVK